MKTIKAEKVESTTKQLQEIRDKISSDIKGMNSEQLKKYADDKLKSKEPKPE